MAITGSGKVIVKSEKRFSDFITLIEADASKMLELVGKSVHTHADKLLHKEWPSLDGRTRSEIEFLSWKYTLDAPHAVAIETGSPANHLLAEATAKWYKENTNMPLNLTVKVYQMINTVGIDPTPFIRPALFHAQFTAPMIIKEYLEKNAKAYKVRK